MRSLLALGFLPLIAGETCLSQVQLLGVVFGSVGASFVLCLFIGILLYCCLKRNVEVKTVEKACDAEAKIVEEKACDTDKTECKNKMTAVDSFKLRKKTAETGTQKSFSSENINEVDKLVGVQMKSEDLGGLGFNIQGSMSEGIFVQNVFPKTPADVCGNVLVGDRIKSLTICFENMVYEDAVTLLSYASPYKVKLELERKMSEQNSEPESAKSPRMHPLFRSNTLTNCHFNPLVGDGARPPSVQSSEKSEVPKAEERPKTESTTTTENNTGAEADVSRMESSDYASDNTSDYRESLSEHTGTESVASTEEPSQSTMPDHIEISSLVVEKPAVSSPSTLRKPQTCTALPPKPPKKVVERSPSPKVASRKPSPVPVVAEEKQLQKVDTEKIYASVIPKATKGIPTPRPPKTKIAAPPVRAPEITEARISRIPKRTDSIKTPIIERKLPTLPRSATQRSQSADTEADSVWSRLYQEKKGTLRKTRENTADPLSPTGSPLPTRASNTIARSPSPQQSPRTQRTQSNDRYGTLNKERRQKLEANQETLDRQREELRKLGVL